MSETDKFTVRDFEPGDEVALLAATQRVLGGDAESPDVWRWRYRDNPAGCVITLGLCGEEIVAHVAAVPIPVSVEGEPFRFLCASRPFVVPERARELRRRGMFGAIAKHFHKTHLGAEATQAPLVFGFPTQPLWRRATRFHDYKLLRTPNKLVGALDAIATEGSKGVDVSEVERFPDDIAALNQAMCEHYLALTRRDAEHLNWRFAAHPDRPYSMAVARSGGEPGGLAVFRRGSFDGENDVGLVCDWVVAPGDAATAAALRAWLVMCARRAGCERLVALVPNTAPDWIDFQRAGMRVRGTSLVLAARHKQRRLTMHWLRRHWYTTLADTDLC